jgi:hypothetical protein
MTLIADIESVVAGFASELAESIVTLLKASSTSELVEILGDGTPTRRPAVRNTSAKKAPGRKPVKTGSGRLARRTPEQIAATVADVARLLSKHSDGLRSEQIREELGLDKREIPRVLQQGVAEGSIKILHGEKRSTTYGAGKGGRSAKAAKKGAKKGAKKTAKRAAKKAKKPAKRAASKKAKKPARKPVSKPVEQAPAKAA